jgi:hypothetical protein
MREIDDLIATASGKTNAPKQSSKPFSIRDVEAFIAEYGVTQGDIPIAKRLVHDYYVQWSKNPLSFRSFCRVFNKMFPLKFYNGICCYYLNHEAFKLPEFYSMGKDSRFFKVKAKPCSYIGVTETFGYYIARLKTEENLHYLGRFKTAKEAAIAYDIEAYKHFGNEAKLNFKQDAKKRGKEKKE